MAHVLLVEDDARIRTGLVRALTNRGHAIDAVTTGLAGLQSMLTQDPEVIILDLGLPDVPGERLLGMIRAASSVPVIVATARDDEGLIVQLLDAGADDYLVKPFSPEQLEARIRAVLRRAAPEDRPAPQAVRIGGLQVDPARRTVEVDGKPVELTRLEFDLLAHLAANAGRIVSRKELLRDVWQRTDSARTVDVHLSWLRRKLGDDPDNPRFVHVHRGVGILLEDARDPSLRTGALASGDRSGPDATAPGAVTPAGVESAADSVPGTEGNTPSADRPVPD